MYKDAHILFSGKKEEPKEKAVFPGSSTLFGVRKDAHVLFSGEKEEPKESGGGRAQLSAFSPLFRFFFQSFYLHRLRLGRRAERVEVFFFSGKKEKPKENGGGGVYVSALSLLFRLLFSFLPLYLHRLRLRRACGKSRGVLFSEKKEEQKTNNVRGNRHLLFRHFCLFFSPSIHFGCRLFFCVSPPRLVSRPAPGRVGVSPPGERAEKGLRPVVLFQGKSGTKRQMTSRWHRYLLFRRLCFFFFFFIPFASAASSAREMDFDPLFFFSGGKRKTKRG